MLQEQGCGLEGIQHGNSVKRTDMRIGIISLRLHTNFGGILQAWALQTVLKRMGHQVEHIETAPTPRYWPNRIYLQPLRYVKRFFVRYVLGNKAIHINQERYEAIRREEQRKEDRIIRQHTDRFIQEHLAIRKVDSYTDITPVEYEALVTGSDQVWRSIYFGKPFEDSFLYFAKDWPIHRLSYAASFGVDRWENPCTSRCKAAVATFHAVGVREDTAVALCERYLGVKAQWVLDPTLLLERSDYLDLIPADRLRSFPAGKLTAYILDATDAIEENIRIVAREKGLEPFFNNNKNAENTHCPAEERIQPPVEDWLRSFHEAQFVVTGSFHACVFSILFNKDFAVIGNQKRGMTRFTSLLKQFGLEPRLVETREEILALPPINWVAVNLRREQLREESIRFLRNGLGME